MLIADIEAALNGGTLPIGGEPWADRPWAEPPPAAAPAGGVDTIRVSDLGWRGTQPYAPLLAEGPSIERRVALAPGASDSVAWGFLRLASPGLIPGTSLAGRDTAMRRVRVRAGMRGFDAARGYPTDPPASALVDVFSGLAMSWQPRDDGAVIPLRDPGAWLAAPIGVRKFLGTGGAEGPADLAGTPWPIVRGGSASVPVRSVPVMLVNAAARVYRWTDTGIPTQLYEDGAPVYTGIGQVADAFAASPGVGNWSWDATGQIRIGSDPQGAVTMDGYGGATLAATVLRDLIVTGLGLPALLFDEDSAINTAAAVPYVGGWAWSGKESARDAIQPLLAALGARLVASRSGGLRPWPLRAIPATARAVAVFDTATAISVSPVSLDAPLAPPAAEWNVGYGRTHSMTANPKASVLPAERERLAQAWRTARWADPANLTRYVQAGRPDLVETALLGALDAQGLANALGALWGVPRGLWQVRVPTAAALVREIGDVVQIRWPADGLGVGLGGGALGQVVGDSLRGGEPTASLLVLV
ncbi:hypothetical protein [Sediminicoccus sp. KRV36]|uniref:hypothetical protein n=1 Tax=Sediminicoccus sp. KRV36 TaxID=3133721 RepID=UPI00200F961F|nr:hypothetical protein [Sediminicoccus rosea]UPY37224.1 hypothetical protein LHU95_00590 [Sediminicoccus rosea]